MKRVDTKGRLAHVLVCTNQRPPDSSMPCCANSTAEEVYEAIRTWLDERGLLARIWLTRTQCMGWCHIAGTTVAIYPEDVWYRAVTPTDVPQILDRHLRPLVD